ncbi:MAG: phosphorylase family protein [Phycisphaerales bacterium]
MRERFLLAVAARVEWRAVCAGVLGVDGEDGGDEGVAWAARSWDAVDLGVCDAVLTGVGKGNAASGIAVAVEAAEALRRGDAGCGAGGVVGVVGIGICGALPGGAGREGAGMLEIGSVVVATDSVYADEGVRTPSGFVSLSEMGFPPDDVLSGAGGDAVDDAGFARGCGALGDAIAARLSAGGVAVERGVIATVSVCSGTDALARDVASRTGAVVEAMEGAAGRAAAQHLSRRFGRVIPFAEVRVVSNNTGDYDRQVWRIGAALGVVRKVAGLVTGTGRG